MPRVEVLTEVSERDPEAAPARSVRRATARRASNRRATARSRQGDTKASIIDFLAKHPGSTAGDLAKSLNLNSESVSKRLNQLSKTGEIKKASHGYSTQQARPDSARTSAHSVAHTEPANQPGLDRDPKPSEADSNSAAPVPEEQQHGRSIPHERVKSSHRQTMVNHPSPPT
jgi:Winged helix-turn-helix DNA-binding